MGFNLPGKSIHSGTNSHRSAVKMYKDAATKMYNDSPADMALKGDQHKLPQHLQDKIEAAPEPGGSPAKAGPLLPILANAGRAAVTRAVPQIIKQAPKIINRSKKKIIDVVGTTVKNPTVKSTIKNVWKSTPGWVKATGAYLGLDAGIDALVGGGDKKSNNTNKSMNKTVTPKKKSGPSPYSKAKKNDPNLGSYIKERKKHKKGSAEYNALQNKINKAYGSKTRHGVESSSSTKGRKTTSSMNVPGISNTKTVTRKRRSGDVKSTKTTDVNTGTTTKRKYTKKGDTKKIVTKKDGMRTVTKKNKKGEVKTKTRKTLNPFD